MLPLINIVFLLLIFFMLLANFNVYAPFPVTPPDAPNSDIDPQGLTVFVSADGRIAVDGRTVKPAALMARLRDRLRAVPPPTVWLRADRGSDSDRVIAIMEQLRAAGATELRLVTNQ